MQKPSHDFDGWVFAKTFTISPPLEDFQVKAAVNFAFEI